MTPTENTIVDKAEPEIETPLCRLTLDDVNDLLLPLERYAFGYTKEGVAASDVVGKLMRWRDKQKGSGRG